jgi:hypothetical protein
MMMLLWLMMVTISMIAHLSSLRGRQSAEDILICQLNGGQQT